MSKDVRLLHGDCREGLARLKAEGVFVDAVVTDPPYALVSIVKRFGGENAAPAADGLYARASRGFMGKTWDTGEIVHDPAFWAQVYDVLKPGGHMLAFAGTRTYHRMVVAIEDAGFEIRDQLGWLYGSGFPKSHDMGKAMDKIKGAERTKIRVDASEVRNPKVIRGGHGIEGGEAPFMVEARRVGFHEKDSDEAVSDEAKQWDGWGTALKPAWEPIVLARKPFRGSIAANVLEHGTGALNIGDCRIESERPTGWGGAAAGGGTWTDENCGLGQNGEARPIEGRWPANVIHDGSPEVEAVFPMTNETTVSVGVEKKVTLFEEEDRREDRREDRGWGMKNKKTAVKPTMKSLGESSAARLFYSAKAQSDDRLDSKHPTVKPIDLMRYLCRLITPPGGTVLDPFSGSGSTLQAALEEGFHAVGCEREDEYVVDIENRINHTRAKLRKLNAEREMSIIPDGPLFEIDDTAITEKVVAPVRAQPPPEPVALTVPVTAPQPATQRPSPPPPPVAAKTPAPPPWERPKAVAPTPPAGAGVGASPVLAPARTVPASVRTRGGGSFSPLVMPDSAWEPPLELPRLVGAARIGIDTENCDPTLTTLGPGVRRGAFIAGISVARDDGFKCYLPMRHEGGDNLDPEIVLRWARDELNNFDGEVVGAQLIYDLDMLAQEGITFPKVKRFLDVQNAEPLLDENRLSFQLETLGREYVGKGKNEDLLREAARAHGWKTVEQIKSNLWRLPARFVGGYGEDDADLPLRILPLQEIKLAEQGLTDLFHLESDIIPMLLAMRRRGVRVNVEKAVQTRDRLIKERDKWLGIVRRHAGPAAELMAAESLGPAIEAKLGLKLNRTTEGAYQINKALLEKHRGDELMDAIAAGRRLQSVISVTFEGAILKHAINGRIHTQFHQLKADKDSEGKKKRGTIARFSSEGPNLQAVPSRTNDMDEFMDFDEDMVELARGPFEPEEGEEWERHDLSQIEYRYLVNFAVGPGADEAREAYRADPKTDFHKMCAKMAHIDPNDEKKRKKIKGVNFSKVFGGGMDKISELLGVSSEEGREFIAMYDRELPFVKETLKKAAEWAQRRGFVITILGRRGRFDLWEPAAYGDKGKPLPHEKALATYGANIKRAKTHAALSRKLQGSAADHFKKAMKLIWEAGICRVIGPPLLLVHDEKDWSRGRDKASLEAIAEAKRLLETAITLKVPTPAEASVGANWGAAS